MNSRGQRRAAKIWLTLGTIGITAGTAFGSHIAIICGLIPLTAGAWDLTTSGHKIRPLSGHSWRATCKHCPSTQTGPLGHVLSEARTHQNHEH